VFGLVIHAPELDKSPCGERSRQQHALSCLGPHRPAPRV